MFYRTNQTLLVCALSVLFSLAVATNSTLVSISVDVPYGTTQHGNSRILCPPTTVRTMTTFFLGNFLAHIATVKTVPGEKLPVTVCNMVLALLFPTSGLMRGLNAIARGVMFAKSELDKACRAGALCVVVRNSNWRPRMYDLLKVILATSDSGKHANAYNTINPRPLSVDHTVNGSMNDMKAAKLEVYHPTWLREDQRWWIFFDTIWGRATVNTLLFDIHGTYRLPPGYSFAVLPRNAIVTPSISDLNHHGDDAGKLSGVSLTISKSPLFKQKSDIASSWSALKILASILQLSFSYYTVYHHQGDQIKRWGYVSFFFTPLPYAVMSFCNGISNLLTPDYPKMYMVHSELMDEAKKAGGAFEGVVGRVIPLVEPVGGEGYRPGFATTWKGISPTSMKRLFWGLIPRFFSRRNPPPNISEAVTCIVCPDGDDTIPFLWMCSKENELDHVYQINSTLVNDSEIFGLTYGSPNGVFRSLLERNTLFVMCWGLYHCIRHPQRTKRHLVEWNKNPWVVKVPQDAVISLIYGVCLLVWSACHFHRTKRFLKNWNKNPRVEVRTDSPLVVLVYVIGLCVWSVFHTNRARCKIQQWIARSGLRGVLLDLNLLQILDRPSQPTGMLPDPDDQATIYYQSCPRFQRYDDLIPQKDLGATITNTAYIASVPTTNDIRRPCASSSRSVGAITWRSTLLPVSLGLFLSGVPMIAIGVLSRFQSGASSPVQRIIMLIWWISGSIIGLLMPLLDVSEILVCIVWLPAYLLEQMNNVAYIPAYGVAQVQAQASLPLVLVVLACVPWGFFVAPIWGFVIVAQMLNEWGSCESLY